MKRFSIAGTDRQAGALGQGEPFALIIEANDEREAREWARQQRYRANREYVSISAVKEFQGIEGVRPERIKT